MKTQKNHSQLKDQENCLKRTIIETDLFSLINTDFKKEIMKILKGLRRTTDRNADYYKKEIETKKGTKKN